MTARLLTPPPYVLNGWHVTLNPDDERYYVAADDDGVASATFVAEDNARYWARRHAPYCPWRPHLGSGGTG